MGKNPDPGSGMNIPDYFSESLETVFRVKILIFFDAGPDPGSEIFLILDPRSRIEKFESGIRDKTSRIPNTDLKTFEVFNSFCLQILNSDTIEELTVRAHCTYNVSTFH